MRLDAHPHFWRYTPEAYPWIDGRMEVLKRDFLPADLAPLLRRHGFEGSIAVQAAQTTDETRWLLGLAEESPAVRGVVGWVDLRDDPRRLDETLAELAAHPRLVGLRHPAQDEPDERFLARDDFCRGVGRLARSGLVFDVLIYARQLPAATELVRRFPQQPLVLDHLGKPDVRRGEHAAWARGLRELARSENLACKLSGLVTEADWETWSPAELAPYLELALEAFGPGRLLFGSDWPVCTLAASYDEVVGLAREALAALSADERAGVLGGNAERIYLAPR